jgi:hypothetical protein
MLSEMLYKLRGIDKWPTTEATVISTKVGYGAHGSWNTILFTYVPSQGSSQQGKLSASDQSTLFGVTVTDTFDVQYDPRNPKRIYCEEAVPAGRGLGIAVVCLVALFILYGVVVACIRGARH